LRRPFSALVSAFCLTLVVSIAFTPLAASAPPADGYTSWRVEDQVDASGIGDVPFRHGDWDSDTDKGFGIDKMENKHSVTNMDMVKWILQVGTKERKPGEMQDQDAQYGTQVRSTASIFTRFCVTDPFSGVHVCGDRKGPFKMLAVVEDEEHDFYWVGRASMKPDPNNPGTPKAGNPNILLGADYVSDERTVGIVTCYQIGRDGAVDKEANDWQFHEEDCVKASVLAAAHENVAAVYDPTGVRSPISRKWSSRFRLRRRGLSFCLFAGPPLPAICQAKSSGARIGILAAVTKTANLVGRLRTNIGPVITR